MICSLQVGCRLYLWFILGFGFQRALFSEVVVASVTSCFDSYSCEKGLRVIIQITPDGLSREGLHAHTAPSPSYAIIEVCISEPAE